MDFSVLADWLTIGFFLWFGLKRFLPVLDQGFFPTLGAILAIAAAICIALS